MNGWPVFEISEEKQAFMNMDSDAEDAQVAGVDNLEDVKGGADPDEEEAEGTALNSKQAGAQVKAGEKWNNLLDVDFSDEEEEPPAKQAGKGGAKEQSGGAGIFVAKEDPIVSAVKKQSNIPGEFVAVGLFKDAVEKLEKQIALKDPATVAPQFYDVFLSSELYYSTMSFVRPHAQYITSAAGPSVPLVANNLKAAERKLKLGYKKTTEGSFDEAVVIFRDILNSVPLMSLNSKADLSSAEKLLAICTEYIIALNCDVEKRKAAAPERQLELTVLMSLPNLHPTHRVLTLRSAMALSFKTKNFLLAAYVARRFLKLCEDNADLVEAEVVSQANKILAKSEKTGTNEYGGLKFEEALFHDENAANLIDCYDLKLLEKSQKTVCCPLTKARYAEKHRGKLCRVSGTTEIGREVVGMKILK